MGHTLVGSKVCSCYRTWLSSQPDFVGLLARSASEGYCPRALRANPSALWHLRSNRKTLRHPRSWHSSSTGHIRFRRLAPRIFRSSGRKKTAPKPNKWSVHVLNEVARGKLGRASRKVCLARKTGEVFEL